MATLTEARADGLWHALGYELPDVCPVHHCWTNECSAGTHDDQSSDGEAA